MKTNIKAGFKVLNTNNKGETSIGLVIKGDLSDAQILALHRLKAVGMVFVDIFDGQASIDDYEHDDETSEEPRKGIAYSVVNGAIETQLTIDEIVAQDELKQAYDEALNGEASEEVTSEMLSAIDKEENGLPFEPQQGELEEELPF